MSDIVAFYPEKSVIAARIVVTVGAGLFFLLCAFNFWPLPRNNVDVVVLFVSFAAMVVSTLLLLRQLLTSGPMLELSDRGIMIAGFGSRQIIPWNTIKTIDATYAWGGSFFGGGGEYLVASLKGEAKEQVHISMGGLNGTIDDFLAALEKRVLPDVIKPALEARKQRDAYAVKFGGYR